MHPAAASPAAGPDPAEEEAEAAYDEAPSPETYTPVGNNPLPALSSPGAYRPAPSSNTPYSANSDAVPAHEAYSAAARVCSVSALVGMSLVACSLSLW
jgi:hypothetical protein